MIYVNITMMQTTASVFLESYKNNQNLLKYFKKSKSNEIWNLRKFYQDNVKNALYNMLL